jgi:hypothetical protein
MAQNRMFLVYKPTGARLFIARCDSTVLQGATPFCAERWFWVEPQNLARFFEAVGRIETDECNGNPQGFALEFDDGGVDAPRD